MAEEGLKELYIDELKDLYSAENQLVKALPKMAKVASSEELAAGFEEHSCSPTLGHFLDWTRSVVHWDRAGPSYKGSYLQYVEVLHVEPRMLLSVLREDSRLEMVHSRKAEMWSILTREERDEMF
jgi:Domain of unknown function (DUF892)